MKNWKIDENCFGQELYHEIHLGSIGVLARIRLDDAEKENDPTDKSLPLIRARRTCASLEILILRHWSVSGARGQRELGSQGIFRRI
jgi:hypothetical protein